MSYRELFRKLINKIDQQEYGTKIEGKDGRLVDTGVQALVDAMRDAMNDPEPINIQEPLVFNNTGNGPSMILNNQGENPSLIMGYDAEGHYVSLGAGLGSEGIVANELIVLPNYGIGFDVAVENYMNAGGQGGKACNSPTGDADNPHPSGGNVGSGLRPCKERSIGSGYGEGESGSGFRWDINGGNDTFFLHTPPIGGGGDGPGPPVGRETATDTFQCFPLGDVQYSWADGVTAGDNYQRIDDLVDDDGYTLTCTADDTDDGEEVIFMMSQPGVRGIITQVEVFVNCNSTSSNIDFDVNIYIQHVAQTPQTETATGGVGETATAFSGLSIRATSDFFPLFVSITPGTIGKSNDLLIDSIHCTVTYTYDPALYERT